MYECVVAVCINNNNYNLSRMFLQVENLMKCLTHSSLVCGLAALALATQPGVQWNGTRFAGELDEVFARGKDNGTGEGLSLLAGMFIRLDLSVGAGIIVWTAISGDMQRNCEFIGLSTEVSLMWDDYLEREISLMC